MELSLFKSASSWSRSGVGALAEELSLERDPLGNELSRDLEPGGRLWLLSLDRDLSRCCLLPKTSCQSDGSSSKGVLLKVGRPLGDTFGSAALGPLGSGG